MYLNTIGNETQLSFKRRDFGTLDCKKWPMILNEHMLNMKFQHLQRNVNWDLKAVTVYPKSKIMVSLCMDDANPTETNKP